MTSSNLWAELAAAYLQTRLAHQDHETAKAELKKLVPEDAKEALGHGIRAKRTKAGAVSFEVKQPGDGHASIQ
jgi:Tfp pilus assembly protein PilF